MASAPSHGLHRHHPNAISRVARQYKHTETSESHSGSAHHRPQLKPCPGLDESLALGPSPQLMPCLRPQALSIRQSSCQSVHSLRVDPSPTLNSA